MPILRRRRTTASPPPMMLLRQKHQPARARTTAAGFAVALLLVLGGATANGTAAAGDAVTSGTGASLSFPIRAAFYDPSFPEEWRASDASVQPTLGHYSSSDAELQRAHIRALEYAGMNAAISSWSGRGTDSDVRLHELLAQTDSLHSRLRWAIYYELEGSQNPSPAAIANDLAYIGNNVAHDRAYLRVHGRFVVFVHNIGDTTCDVADRWSAANREIGDAAYIVLKVFPGYGACRSQPSAWHQYGPADAIVKARDSYTISPGFDRVGEAAPRLSRSLPRFRRSIEKMIDSRAPWQLVTTFNGWNDGSAVESSDAWSTSSGRGMYLDALHRALAGASETKPLAATSTTSDAPISSSIVADSAAPSVPTGLAKVSATQTTISVTWNTSTDNVAVAGYHTYRNGTKTYTTTTTSHMFSYNLSCGTSYTLGVNAFDAAGNTSAQATLVASTAPCTNDTTPPTTPGGLAVLGKTQTSITLGWSASTDNAGVAGYHTYRDGVLTATESTTTHTFAANLTCGTTYTLAVDAFDAAGNVSSRASLGATTAPCTTTDTAPPTTPAALAVISSTQTSITVGWVASSDNVAVTGYDVFRDTTKAGTTTSTSYTLSNLTCGTSYAVAVDAFDAAANVSGRAAINAATAACATADTFAPLTPTTLTATGATQTSISVTWSPSADNVAVAGYDMFRNGTKVGTTTSTSYMFSGLTCGTRYTLGVAAFDAAGNVSSAATMTASTDPCVDTTAPSAPTGLAIVTVTQTSVSLTWLPSTDNVAVAGYDAYRNGTKTDTTIMTSDSFGSLTCGTTYTFGVDSYDAAGNHSPTTTITSSTSACADTSAPSAPAGLTVSSASGSSIALGWTASTDNVGVVGYDLYLNGSKKGTTSSTSYSFSNLSCGASYTLGVDAYDAAGNRSAMKSVVSATTACPTTTSGPCGSKIGQAPTTFSHVIWIVFENHSYSQIIGSSSAPYFNSIASKCGLATSYKGVTHPSLPNYIAMTSGSTQGITDDNGPSSHPLSAASIFSQLGGGWKSLQESMSSSCALSSSGSYAVKHNPAAYYTNVRTACASQDIPLGSTPDVSARFTFVTPNLCNDMHDCSVATGDTWLSKFLPKILGSSTYTGGGTAVFITFDEDDFTTTNKVATIVVSPYTAPGTTNGTAFTHYSLLRSTEEMLGVGCLANACTASSMRASFGLAP